jgi:23S rRNA pseudouridine1911/1915/1917 synthase
MSLRQIEFVIGDNPPTRLDKALARDAPEGHGLSRTRIARLIEEGAVRVDAIVMTNLKAAVEPGARVEIEVQVAAESHMLPQQIPLDVVFEDESLVVVNKPPGMVVHPAPGTRDGTLVNALLAHCGESLSGVGGARRPGIVHRIDKDTSGLLVVAKTDAAHQGLAAQFEAHSVERVYTALVYGVPDANDPRLRGVRGASFETGNVLKLTTQLARHRTDRQRQAVTFEGGRHAVTRAMRVATFGAPPVLSLMDCWLETGRTHQIRVHLAHAGHALVGDPVYGGRRKLPKGALSPEAVAATVGFARQALHARSLGFVHPVSGARLEFEAPLPQDLDRLLAVLGDEGTTDVPKG